MRGKLIVKRLREATAATAAPALLRGQSEPDEDEVRTGGPGDGDADDQPCPTCDASGIADGMICEECGGSGSIMKESTSGPYWVYSDDSEWEQLREANRAFSADVRKKFAGSGVAMPDGSFPIPDKDALGRAIKLAGNAKDPAKAKAHIRKRAAALGATDMLPDSWKSKTKESTVLVQMSPELQQELDGLREQIDNIDVFQKLREAKPGSMMPTFSTPTRVKTSGGQEGYLVTLIREGRGNHEDDQWYTVGSVKELVESGVAEGMQAFSNHPDLEEEEKRPERDVKELVGTYHDVKFVVESGKPARADAIFVPLTLDENHPRYGWIVTLAEAAVRSTAPQPICGISLYGLSAGDDGQRPDGTYGRMVEVIRPASGDIVTNAGAGGGFIRQLMESARALRTKSTTKPKEISPMEALAYQRAVREAAKRVREADSDEARTEALEALGALESESIDNAPDSVQALREAAPKLVEEIEASVKAETEPTVEQLQEANTRLTSQLSAVTDAMSTTKALREAGVSDEVELRHYAGLARQRGLTDETDIREMVETDTAFRKAEREATLAAVREAFGEDAEVEGFGGRIPTPALPEDGGLATLRESGIPVLETAE